MNSRILAGIVLLSIVSAAACHRQKSPDAATTPDYDSTTSTQTFLPAIGFLRLQVSQLDSVRGALKLRGSHNGQRYSSEIRPSMAMAMASIFIQRDLNQPDYTQTTFPDSNDNSIVVSYMAKEDTTPLNTVDVYVDSVTHTIKRLYLLYQQDFGDSSVRHQLIWRTGSEFTLITTVDKGGYTSDRRTDSVSWSQP